MRNNDTYPNGVLHILRETRAQRRLKVGTDAGRPVFSDERDPNITDHAYDLLRYAVAAREPSPTEKSNRVRDVPPCAATDEAPLPGHDGSLKTTSPASDEWTRNRHPPDPAKTEIRLVLPQFKPPHVAVQIGVNERVDRCAIVRMVEHHGCSTKVDLLRFCKQWHAIIDCELVGHRIDRALFLRHRLFLQPTKKPPSDAVCVNSGGFGARVRRADSGASVVTEY